MLRIATSAVCAVFLSACANLPDWAAARHILNGDTSDPGLAHYDFNWHLSGERHVAPLQVFDDGRQTWLHFLSDQIVPAIFQHTAQGDRLLPYVRQGEYLLLDGVWPALSFRGGGLRAWAHKQIPDEAGNHPAADIEAEHGPDALQQFNDNSVSSPLDEDGSSYSIQVGTADSKPVSDDVRRLTDASFERIEQASYRVRLQDQNLRNALHRWAGQANWTFAPEHWDVDVDIPISGEADFHGSFQDAVQDVLASTELADHPLRPCFYSNHVLRVVAYSQSCDRSGAQTS